MIGVGIEGVPPYTDVLTHGWVLDAEGRAMHKSLGNVISPETVLKRYGADIVRWWALATDWRSDVRIGDEILERCADAYRKVRNTFRFLLGNLDDFTPSLAQADGELTAVDRAFAAHLEARLARMRTDYERFHFHRVADALLDVCTVDLSSVFLDAAKDRLCILARPTDSALGADGAVARAAWAGHAASPISRSPPRRYGRAIPAIAKPRASTSRWPAESKRLDSDERALVEQRRSQRGARANARRQRAGQHARGRGGGHRTTRSGDTPESFCGGAAGLPAGRGRKDGGRAGRATSPGTEDVHDALRPLLDLPGGRSPRGGGLSLCSRCVSALETTRR